MNVFEKIEAQQGKSRTAVWMVGEQLKDIIRHDRKAQELVLQDLDVPEMSLDKCERKIKAYADSHKTGNFACVTPAEAEDIIREFYGLGKAAEAEARPMGKVVDLASYF